MDCTLHILSASLAVVTSGNSVFRVYLAADGVVYSRFTEPPEESDDYSFAGRVNCPSMKSSQL